MDNNNLQDPTPIPPTAALAPADAQPTVNPLTQNPNLDLGITKASGSGDSKKMVMFLVLGVVVIALIIGGVYLFFSKNNETAMVPTQTPVAVAQTPAPSPSAQPDAIEAQINSVDTTSIDNSMSGVDQDLKGL